MKVFNLGLDITPGKHKYKLEWFDKLVDKFSPQKVSYYSVEFTGSVPETADAVVFDANKSLDLVLIDLERIEKRLSRSEDEDERFLLTGAQKVLEEEKMLCDGGFSSQETETFKLLQLVTAKPCLALNSDVEVNEVIRKIIEKAGIILFFTAGKKEVHAWELKRGESILEAAGKIHSDLKKGFIRAEVISITGLDNFFNMAEAKSRGLVKTVDRDYIVQNGDIIEIRFKV
jgi:hypothetical protein